MKKYIFIFLLFLIALPVWAQLFGGQIKSKVTPLQQPNYPQGSIFCNGSNTLVVDVLNPITGKTWMDRNLGAVRLATGSTDSLAYGDLYQWGRRSDGHQCRNSLTTLTLSSIDQPIHGDFIISSAFPFDWRTTQNNSLWQGVNGINNPCPNGYRLPTETELDNERLNFINQNNVGAFNSSLKLTMSGARNYLDGLIYSLGSNGGYWTSSLNGSDVRYLSFDNFNAYFGDDGKASGYAVRCIKEIVGTVNSLNCISAVNSGSLIQGAAANNVTSTIPYDGGNGGYYPAQSFTSSGVLGLTATITQGVFVIGSGNLILNISGTPLSAGNATFVITLGGQSCSLSVTVNVNQGSISALNCLGAINTGTLVESVAANGVSSSIPYTGGVSGSHNGQTINSTGVIGLSATLLPGNFINGNGSLSYTISGTPISTGIASFALNIGGQSCTLNLNVTSFLASQYSSGSTFCAAGPTLIVDVTNPTTGKTWMDRNLGASRVATTNNDAQAYGDLYQWGRGTDGHQCRNSTTTTTLSSTDQPGNGNFIRNAGGDWRSPQNPYLWLSYSGVNNPCPNNYRLPTESELEAERLSWATNNTNGAFGSPLKLTMGGYRDFSTATISSAGTYGYYWNSNTVTTVSGFMYFYNTGAESNSASRGFGFSVRCIKDGSANVTAINCGSASTSGTVTQSSPAVNVSITVPYSGGNGGSYSAQTILSTGVIGLFANLSSGTLANGSGSLTFTISGTAIGSGTANFTVRMGSQSCTFSINVIALVNRYTPGATFCANGPTPIFEVTNANTGKVWMDRNLGASRPANSETDAQSYGDLYQWGRNIDGHQCRNSTLTSTLSSTDQPANGSFITTSAGNYDWRNPQNDNLWQGVNGINNPCPSGFRLPTDAEFNAERLSWSVNNSLGSFGAAVKISLAGYRNFISGTVTSAGSDGYYWTSSINSTNANMMFIGLQNAALQSYQRSYGLSVRCIKN